VIRLLKYFTFLDMDQVGELEKQVQTEPEKRQAQKVLARKSPAWSTVQANQAGPERLGGAVRRRSRPFRPGPGRHLRRCAQHQWPRQRLEQGIGLIDALCETGLCPSRGQAKKLISSGGVYLNNVRWTGGAEPHGSVAGLGAHPDPATGKKTYHLLKFG